MDQTARGYSRKKLLIDPGFQLSIISFACLTGLLTTLILFAANRYYFRQIAGRGERLGLPADHVFFQFVAEQRAQMDLIYAGTALASFALIFAFGLYFSHRIAGPLHHVRRNLRARLAGEPDRPIQFRKNDYFHDLASDLNQYFERCGKKE